jgi:hypothetical protein
VELVRIANGIDPGNGVTDDETIALRATVIAGKRYDDFTVIWRGLSIGRIMQAAECRTVVDWDI